MRAAACAACRGAPRDSPVPAGVPRRSNAGSLKSTIRRCSYRNLGSGILSALAVFSIDRSSELLLTPQSLRAQTQPPNGGHPHSLWLVHQQESMGRLPAAAALWVDRDPITSDHW